jgi:hypothetical protein
MLSAVGLGTYCPQLQRHTRVGEKDRQDAPLSHNLLHLNYSQDVSNKQIYS